MALAVALLCAAACGGGRSRPADAEGPAVRLRLEALDGGEIDTARYRGRVVVLHLFDIGSPTAPHDVDQLNALARAQPERAQVIGIALDPEGHRLAAPWRRAVEATYLIALGDADLREGRSQLGQVRVVPTTVVLDRNGVLRERVERALARDELAKLVGPHLGR